MNFKDIFFTYLLFLIVISLNILGAFLYINYWTRLPDYFIGTLGFIGVAFMVFQLILIGNFGYKAFKEYFNWS